MDDQESLYAEIGRKIRKKRDALGMTQQQLSSLVGLTRTSITNIERGTQKLLVHTLIDFARALQTSPAWFLNNEGQIASNEQETFNDLLKQVPLEDQKWIKATLKSKKKGG
jgi:transcriptional regulator with XRE-family HTH domain